MRCAECDLVEGTRFDDPRDPPIEEYPCLCRSCYKAALEALIDEAEIDLAGMKETLSRLSPRDGEGGA